MKLIACSSCHTQYDVADLAPGNVFACRCGSNLEVKLVEGKDAVVQRCSACGALAREDEENCSYCDAEIVHVGELGSLICPECFACNAEDGRFCVACGVGFEPEPMGSEKSELRCPCCERWMATRGVAGLEIQECKKCKGLWAPEDRFEALVDRASAQVREKAAAGEKLEPRVEGGNPTQSKVEYRRCPECDELMGRRNFRKRSGVIIDQCHQHGTWLDADELERIAGFVLSGRADHAERLIATEQADRERDAARKAAQRMIIGTEYQQPTSMFGSRSDSSAIGSVFDLLQSLLTR